MSNEDKDEAKDDAELSTWRGEWQSLGGREDLASELVARAAKDGKRMRMSAAREVLAALFSTIVCLWLMVRTHGAVEVVAMTGLILFFNGAWLTHFFTLRANLFASSGEGVASFIELTRNRLVTERKWTVFARRWTTAIGAAVVPWSVWVIIVHKDAYRAEPWRAFVGFGVAAAILAGVYFWTRRKERKLTAEADAFERHIADVELA
jgi:hypothetical protein